MRWRGAAVGLVDIADLTGGGIFVCDEVQGKTPCFYIVGVAYYLHKESVLSVNFTLEQPTSVIR